MSWSIMRLTSLGRGQGPWRLLGIVFGIAVGVGLLLTLLGAAQGLTDRDQRRSWLNVQNDFATDTDGRPIPLTDDTVLIGRFIDYVDGTAIDRIAVAFTPETTVTTPWGAPLPEPGTYYASPALIALIEQWPPEQLGDRFGRPIGAIPASALASPDSIVVLAGRDEATLRNFNALWLQRALEGAPSGANPVYRLVMIVGGIALFLPVLLFISTVTQLGAVERAERLSTLRLIGATPEYVTRMAMLEMGALALIGALLGVAGWWLLRPIGARFRIDDGRFYPNDLNVATGAILLIVLGAVLATSLVAGMRISRLGIGPLGVTRERSERSPSPVGLLLLAAGLGFFAWSSLTYKTSRINYQLLELLLIGGFLLTALGVIAAGPWLTNAVSRAAGRLAGSAAGVVAAGRISRHPSATFRSVSGLVLAVFTVTVFAGSASSVIEADDPRDGAGVFPTSLVYAMPLTGASSASLAPLLGELRQLPGVTAAVIALEATDNAGVWYLRREDAAAVNVTLPEERQPWVTFDGYGYIWANPDDFRPAPEGVDILPATTPVTILVATDGDAGTIETVRTALDRSSLVSSFGRTRADERDLSSRRFVNSLANLAYIGIAITILIAGISLTVATAASMIERKRVFGLLRLMGMPNGVINRIVAFEAIVPLVAVLALTIGLGFLISWILVEGLSFERSLHAPDARYYLAILGSFGLAIGSVLAVAGLIHRHTGINQTRFE